MSDDPCGFVVNVFGSPEAAERAAATLVSDGFSPEQLAVVSGADQVPGLAESLEECGVPRADAAYFADEVRGGRALVAVRCHASDCKGVRVTLGRHGGMVHVPTNCARPVRRRRLVGTRSAGASTPVASFSNWRGPS